MSNHQKQSLSKLEKAKARKKPVLNMRFVKGLEIAAEGHVRKIVPSTTSATLYKVESQSYDMEYDVVVEKSGNIFCVCGDAQSRPWLVCKHIYAVICSDVNMQVEIKAVDTKREKVASGSEFEL